MTIRRLVFGIGGGLLLSFLFMGRPVFAVEASPVVKISSEAYAMNSGAELASPSYSFTALEPDSCLEKLYTCPVVTPTLVQPQNDQVYQTAARVIFTGLSWNETKIDVYVDGDRMGRADLRTDTSGVGNFVFRPKGLKPGKHYMYVIAWNLGEWERSPKTPTVFFTIAEAVVPKQPTPVATAPETNQSSSSTSTQATSTEQTPSAGTILDWFFNKQGTGTSTATTTADRVRSSGMAVLIGVLVVMILGFIIHHFNQKKNGKPGTSDIPPDQHVPTDDNAPPTM